MTIPSLVQDQLAAIAADYEILGEIGRGGISVVYLARDRELEREVAIKVIRDRFLDDPDARIRIDREARTLAQLHHPNIVTILGARRLGDGSLALVMQLARGSTLRQAIERDGPLGVERAREVLRQLASALGYVHRHGIVHRDVKPENIFVEEDGRVLLSDLGIAKANDAQTNVTLTGVVVGTPAYMSPEQIDGVPLDGRSDLYSLGLLGHELLTGRRPWEGENLFNVILKQKTQALPSLAEQRPDVPAALREALERALHKERDERWADMAEFLRALDEPAARPTEEGEPEGPAAIVAASHPPLPSVAETENRVALVDRVVAETDAAAGAAGYPPLRRSRGPMLAAAAVVLLVGGAGAALSVGLVGFGGGSSPAPAAKLAAAPVPLSAAPLPLPAAAAPRADSAPLPTDPSRPAASGIVPAPAAPSASPAAALRPPAPRPAAPAAAQPADPPPSAPVPVGTLAVSATPQPVAVASRNPVALPPSQMLTSAPELRNASVVQGHVNRLYTNTLIQQQVGGTVTLVLQIDTEGRVTASELASSSGNLQLDAIALQASRRMLFRPAERGGVPVNTRIRVPLHLNPPANE